MICSGLWNCMELVTTSRSVVMKQKNSIMDSLQRSGGLTEVCRVSVLI